MSGPYSISGPSTGPITVPRDARWETPEWTWAFWLKVPNGSSISKIGAMATSLVGNSTTSGVDFELYYAILNIDLLGQQYGLYPGGDGLWHHVAACFDATDLRLYKDGALLQTHAMGPMVWGTGDLVLGGFDDPTTLMKGIRIYTRKLSITDVGALAAGGEVTPGLLADWRCNEGSGRTITDSVSGLVGTAAGTITWSTDVPGQNPDAPIVVAPPGTTRRRGGLGAYRRAKIAASFKLPPRQS